MNSRIVDRQRLAAVLIVLAATLCVGAAEPYKRSLYRHWVDADHDCQNTRVEVLIAESLVPVTLSANGCDVVSGQWLDACTGRTLTNPRLLDIDHMIPLKEVHLSGGDQWDATRRQAYANDLEDERTLIAVSASANRAKADKDPARWLPGNRPYLCTYIANWIAVKERWELSIDARERASIDRIQEDCRENG